MGRRECGIGGLGGWRDASKASSLARVSLVSQFGLAMTEVVKLVKRIRGVISFIMGSCGCVCLKKKSQAKSKRLGREVFLIREFEYLHRGQCIVAVGLYFIAVLKDSWTFAFLLEREGKRNSVGIRP